MAENNTLDYYIKTTWQTIANRYNQLTAPYGFTQATGYVLINIRKEGTAVTQIATLLGVKSTSLSRMLNGMEKQGLIYRQVDALDKRSVRVFLTPEGKAKRDMAKNLVKDFNQYCEENIKESDRIKLIALLKRLNELTGKYTPKG